jgi:hypothetical protein
MLSIEGALQGTSRRRAMPIRLWRPLRPTALAKDRNGVALSQRCRRAGRRTVRFNTRRLSLSGAERASDTEPVASNAELRCKGIIPE